MPNEEKKKQLPPAGGTLETPPEDADRDPALAQAEVLLTDALRNGDITLDQWQRAEARLRSMAADQGLTRAAGAVGGVAAVVMQVLAESQAQVAERRQREAERQLAALEQAAENRARAAIAEVKNLFGSHVIDTLAGIALGRVPATTEERAAAEESLRVLDSPDFEQQLLRRYQQYIESQETLFAGLASEDSLLELARRTPATFLTDNADFVLGSALPGIPLDSIGTAALRTNIREGLRLAVRVAAQESVAQRVFLDRLKDIRDVLAARVDDARLPPGQRDALAAALEALDAGKFDMVDRFLEARRANPGLTAQMFLDQEVPAIVTRALAGTEIGTAIQGQTTASGVIDALMRFETPEQAARRRQGEQRRTALQVRLQRAQPNLTPEQVAQGQAILQRLQGEGDAADLEAAEREVAALEQVAKGEEGRQQAQAQAGADLGRAIDAEIATLEQRIASGAFPADQVEAAKQRLTALRQMRQNITPELAAGVAASGQSAEEFLRQRVPRPTLPKPPLSGDLGTAEALAGGTTEEQLRENEPPNIFATDEERRAFRDRRLAQEEQAIRARGQTTPAPLLEQEVAGFREAIEQEPELTEEALARAREAGKAASTRRLVPRVVTRR